MKRRIRLAFVAMFGAAVVTILTMSSSPAHGQAASRGIPLSGVVRDAASAPIPEASVVLIRHSGQAPRSTGQEILAWGTTDAAGRFSLGSVVLNTEVAFPLETQVSWEYAVFTKSVARTVQDVAFTAPRSNSGVTAVVAEIQIR